MSKASIHRRLCELEAVTAWAHTIDYPPLAHAEIIEIEQRMRAGGRLTRPEMDRLEQYSPIVDGELRMFINEERRQADAQRRDVGGVGNDQASTE